METCGNFSEVLSNAVGIAAIGIAMIEWEEACGRGVLKSGKVLAVK
jgi:hypothetical protein